MKLYYNQYLLIAAVLAATSSTTDASSRHLRGNQRGLKKDKRDDNGKDEPENKAVVYPYGVSQSGQQHPGLTQTFNNASNEDKNDKKGDDNNIQNMASMYPYGVSQSGQQHPGLTNNVSNEEKKDKKDDDNNIQNMASSTRNPWEEHPVLESSAFTNSNNANQQQGSDDSSGGDNKNKNKAQDYAGGNANVQYPYGEGHPGLTSNQFYSPVSNPKQEQNKKKKKNDEDDSDDDKKNKAQNFAGGDVSAKYPYGQGHPGLTNYADKYDPGTVPVQSNNGVPSCYPNCQQYAMNYAQQGGTNNRAAGGNVQKIDGGDFVYNVHRDPTHKTTITVQEANGNVITIEETSA